MATDAPASSARRFGIRRILGWVQVALTLAVIAFWFFELRPIGLGGPASYALVSGKSMLPLYHTGDIVIVHRHASYHAGQVIAYKIPKGQVGAGAQVIHRIIGGNGATGFVVQGDNRTAPDIWHPKTSDVVGSAWVHIPKLGVVVRFLHAPLVLASLAAGVAIASVLLHGARKPKREDEEQPSPPAAAAAPPPEPEPAPLPVAAPEPAPEPAPPQAVAAPALAPQELRASSFETRFRGYDRGQVREALDRLAGELDRVLASVAELRAQRDELAAAGELERQALTAELDEARRAHEELRERFEALEREHTLLIERAAADLARQKELESSLTETLLSAERSGAELRLRVQREAEAILADAQLRAREMTLQAELDRAEALGEARAIRARLESALATLAAHRSAPEPPPSSEDWRSRLLGDDERA